MGQVREKRGPEPLDPPMSIDISAAEITWGACGTTSTLLLFKILIITKNNRKQIDLKIDIIYNHIG
jgi:hypothetical protein